MSDFTAKAIEALNQAYRADPNAIHSLMCNSVPCNQDLADDPNIIVSDNPIDTTNNFRVSALGLINGIFKANGLPFIAMKWAETDITNKFERYFVGFCVYGEKDESDL